MFLKQRNHILPLQQNYGLTKPRRNPQVPGKNPPKKPTTQIVCLDCGFSLPSWNLCSFKFGSFPSFPRKVGQKFIRNHHPSPHTAQVHPSNNPTSHPIHPISPYLQTIKTWTGEHLQWPSKRWRPLDMSFPCWNCFKKRRWNSVTILERIIWPNSIDKFAVSFCGWACY